MTKLLEEYLILSENKTIVEHKLLTLNNELLLFFPNGYEFRTIENPQLFQADRFLFAGTGSMYNPFFIRALLPSNVRDNNNGIDVLNVHLDLNNLQEEIIIGNLMNSLFKSNLGYDRVLLDGKSVIAHYSSLDNIKNIIVGNVSSNSFESGKFKLLKDTEI
jgi:hypothetical protein